MNYYGQTPLKDEVHERYCHERSQGFGRGKAYQRAQVIEEHDDREPVKSATARTMAYRLERREDIQLRIKFLKNYRAKKYKSMENAIEQKYRKAINNKAFSESNHLRALEGASKFIGKGLEQHNHTHGGEIKINVNFE